MGPDLILQDSRFHIFFIKTKTKIHKWVSIRTLNQNLYNKKSDELLSRKTYLRYYKIFKMFRKSH